MNKIALKKSIILFITFVMIFTMVLASDLTEAQATDPPLAELYFYNHGDVGGLAAVNTATYKYSTESKIDNCGYNCYSYTNVQAGPSSSSSVVRTLDDDAVFMIHAHAGQGRIACVDNSNNITRVAADITSYSNSYSLEYNFGSTTDKLKEMKLAVWWGCHTYGTSSTYGNLGTRSNSLGVDCNVTQNNTSYPAYANYFLYRFAYYCDQGQSVATALSNARASAYQIYETSSNVQASVNYYVISGANTNPGSTTLEPASYGAY